ncbi:MAG TPA: MAE_28990/MAE_18760 family HEPN-like nuclease [Campylobacterales bacterium]|nr:MAE_28990/MAE_18760 family HEPN-like nuclease [Campylobacterales bacterium]
MNKALLDNFIKEIEDIEKYIKYIEIVNRSATNFQEMIPSLYEHLNQNNTQIKIFEFKAMIISLYGILERYIEIWIKEYINNLPKIFNYYSLIPSEQLKKNHLDLSAKLIHIINEKKQPKFSKLKASDVIHNLNNCLSDSVSFTLNADAFTIQSGNLKHGIISDLLKKISITQLDEALKQDKEMSLMLKEMFGEDFAGRKSETLFKRIDNLVDRRNEIAHGAENIVIDNNEISEYIKFLKPYGRVVFSAINHEELKATVSEKCFKVDENDIKGVFCKNILGIAVTDYLIKLGDTIIIQSNGVFKTAKITNLQLRNQNIKRIKRARKTNIGIKLDIEISKRNNFFLFKQ